MLEKYKGDTPDNVLTPQEVKQKKAFYKDWKFWVLSALITLFGFCSVYGFVLGTRYVHAVQEAAHVIADAKSGGVAESGTQPNAKKAVNAISDYVTFDTTLTNFIGRYDLVDNTTGIDEGHPYARVYGDGDNYYFQLGFRIGGQNRQVYFYEWHTTFWGVSLWFNGNPIDVESYFSTPLGSAITLGSSNGAVRVKGNFSLYPEASGEEIGYGEGYQEGYQEGYSDGYATLAGAQNINVTFDEGFPTLNQINYSWSVDGSIVDSGSFVVRPNVQIPVKTFTRPGGYTHTAELNLWSENDEPLVIAYGRHEGLVIGGTQTYIYDTYNKTNSYEFGENNRYVWYVPTYWPNALFYIRSYGTWNQGYANDCYFEFDPEHNDRSKVGAYADGYQDGYHDATESGDAYDAGKEAGYEQGYQTGVTDGKNQGYAEATGGTKALAYMFVTAFQQPFDQLYRFLNFNLLGINLLALFSALVTLSLGIYVLKKVL